MWLIARIFCVSCCCGALSSSRCSIFCSCIHSTSSHLVNQRTVWHHKMESRKVIGQTAAANSRDTLHMRMSSTDICYPWPFLHHISVWQHWGRGRGQSYTGYHPVTSSRLGWLDFFFFLTSLHVCMAHLDRAKRVQASCKPCRRNRSLHAVTEAHHGERAWVWERAQAHDRSSRVDQRTVCFPPFFGPFLLLPLRFLHICEKLLYS